MFGVNILRPRFGISRNVDGDLLPLGDVRKEQGGQLTSVVAERPDERPARQSDALIGR